MSEVLETMMDTVGSDEVVETTTTVLDTAKDKVMDVVQLDLGLKEGLFIAGAAAAGTAVVAVVKEPAKKAAHRVACWLKIDKDSRDLRRTERELKAEEKKIEAEKKKAELELKKLDREKNSEKKDK